MTTLVTNNATTTLASSLTSAATSISLTAGGGVLFPNPTGGAYCWCTLSNTGGAIEVVKVTARSTDTLTVVRGQDNTTAKAWNAGDKLELRPCAALFNDKMDVLSATGRLLNIQVITSTQVYTPTTGTTSIIADLIGGGGGGGGCSAAASGQAGGSQNGGAGGRALHRMTSGFSGLTVTIGALGAGGGANASGGNGGTTMLGAVASASGGFGGTGGNPSSTGSGAVNGSGAPGGSAAGGNIANVNGQPGTPNQYSLSTNMATWGMGGHTPYGVGATGVLNNTGASALGYGAGGSGLVSIGVQGAFGGGNGGPGLAIIYEYA